MGDWATDGGRLGPDVWAGASADPVFVLCCGGSGSTLLRSLLDAHPDLACPPENLLPSLCVQLVGVWSLIEGRQPLEGWSPLPADMVAGVRRTADMMLGPYLVSRGKKRYCDKNRDTAEHVDLLLKVFPEASFLCLHRHPMDMIAAGIEACANGQDSREFEPYLANSPQNIVLALARYWADRTATILAVEDRYPGRCHRVRYEDLAAEPELAAGEILGFLDLPPAPGISSGCFTLGRERWGTIDGPPGKGWLVSAKVIPVPVIVALNQLTDKLGYIRVGETWGVGSKPADMRMSLLEEWPPPCIS